MRAYEINRIAEISGIPMTSNCRTHTYSLTHTRAHTRARAGTHIHKRAAEITEKRPLNADEEQQQKGHSYTVIHISIHKSVAKINKIAVPR